jgi:hypothetical protein
MTTRQDVQARLRSDGETWRQRRDEEASDPAYLAHKFRVASHQLGSIGGFDLVPYLNDPGLTRGEARTLAAVVDRLAYCTDRLQQLARRKHGQAERGETQ